MRLFTKSAFKQALRCPASLYYYYDRENYANQMNEDDFLQALAEGGQQVGDLAKVYYGVKKDADIETLEYEPALKCTAELLRRDDVNIAEAAFRWKDCFVRADIIEKKGKHINLVEVKAKSWNPDTDSFRQKRRKDCVDSHILEYVYDVAFQKHVIQNALGPEYTVHAFLMMADKRVASDAPDGINQFFRIEKEDGRAKVRREPGADKLCARAHVLTPFDVDDLCDSIIAGATGEQMKLMGCTFKEFVDEMARQYVNHERHFSPLGSRCFKCPFHTGEKTRDKLDGRKECWMTVAHLSEEDLRRPLVQDLWGLYINRDKFIKDGKYFLSDLGKEDFTPTEQVRPGLTHVERKLLQIGLATGDEAILAPYRKNIHDGVYLDIPGLKAEMEGPADGSGGWRFPLHMIDFETTAVALPFYEGMHPYEQVAFQFSHHVINEDGTIEHRGQYINTEKHHFPNFEFVRQLKDVVGGEGTIFRYATHENTILRAIRRQLVDSDEAGKDELIAFIDDITQPTDEETAAGVMDRSTRKMVDLLDIVKRFYYHPDMKGSNSIKAVLPAILNSSKAIREKYSKPIYGSGIHSENYTPDEAIAWIRTGPDGKVDNPYKHLGTIASFLDVSTEELERYDTARAMDESICNGGAALAAYTKLQFADEVCTKALEKALLRYCELDTMSMVFIWEYFREMLDKG